MRYHNITKCDMLNGDGIRVVLWVAGCEHKCKGCHNRITWDLNGGLLFDESAKMEIFNELSKDYVSGLTLSGGDPMHTKNRDDILLLVQEVKEKYPSKNIWMYTGYEYVDIAKHPIMKYIDVLIDGKFIESLKDDSLEWRGSSNQKIYKLSEG